MGLAAGVIDIFDAGRRALGDLSCENRNLNYTIKVHYLLHVGTLHPFLWLPAVVSHLPDPAITSRYESCIPTQCNSVRREFSNASHWPFILSVIYIHVETSLMWGAGVLLLLCHGLLRNTGSETQRLAGASLGQPQSIFCHGYSLHQRCVGQWPEGAEPSLSGRK